MVETVSVRINKEELKEIAIEKFRKNKATAWKAARLAGISLSKFMSILVEKGIDFHYGLKELNEDFETAKNRA